MNQPQQKPSRQAAPRPTQNPLRAVAAVTSPPAVATPDAARETLAEDGVEPVQKRQRQRPETRAQLLERLLNPQISLHEAAILLRVCPATVRNYANAGLLPHVRTAGRQRRFYLRDVLVLLRQLDGARK